MTLTDNLELERTQPSLEEIQNWTGYPFRNPDLLRQAVTHSSYSNEFAYRDDPENVLADNERLEFLGDAVLGLIIAQILMDLFPNATEGRLSRWRSSLVSRKTLAELAAKISLGNFVLLGKGERRTEGAKKSSILAAVLEALIGAMYLDGGLEAVTVFLRKLYDPLFKDLKDNTGFFHRVVDTKTYLQEKTQDLYRSAPVYRVVDSWGLEHQKNFKVQIEIAGKVVAEGSGGSKKEAEQEAAARALQILEF